MDQEIELILERLKGSTPTNGVELVGFSTNAISKLIRDGLIVRVKDRSRSGTLSKYYLSGQSV